MSDTGVSVRLWREGMFACHLTTHGRPHLRISADKEIIAEEPIVDWQQARARALALQQLARRTLATLDVGASVH